MKKCPFCAEDIQDAAIKCRYCGSLFDQPATLAASVSQPTTAPASDGWYPGKGASTEQPKLKQTSFATWVVVGSLVVVGSVVIAGIGILGSLMGSTPPQSSTAAAITPSAPQPAPTAAQIAPTPKPAPTAARTPAPAQNTAAAESARAAVRKMVDLGLIKRMDATTGKFYIDGPLWVGFELDGKENIVKVISGYREAEYKGLPQVTLYESRSGKELANYGAFSGVTIK